MNNIYIETLESTNDYLNEISKDKILENFTTVFCGIQNKGKGQRGNIWYSSPFKNLTCSIILYPNLKSINNFDLNIMVSLSIKKTLDDIIDKVKIKWPNDIYVNNRKISGILIENILKNNIIVKSIIGIGLNINEEDFPENIPNPTSIFIETNKILDINIILNNLIFNMKNIFSNFFLKKEYYRGIYKKYILFFGEERMYKDKNSIFKGKIVDISDDGRLIVLNDKVIKEYYFKEIEYIF